MTAVFQSNYSFSLGFHPKKEGEKKSEGASKLERSALKIVLSWIPIVGAIIAAIELKAAYNAYKNAILQQDETAKIQARGVMIRSGFGIATLGCNGPIMMFIDAAFGIGRKATAEK